MSSDGEAVERARRGVRLWVRGAGRQLRRGAPYTVLAFLVASAVAPVAAVTMGASAAYTALLSQLGAMGAGHLGALLAETANRLRGRVPEPSGQQWRDAVAEALEPALAADDERGRELRAEVSQILRGVDAVAVAFAESTEDGQELRHELAGALAMLGADVEDLRWLVRDALAALDTMQTDLAVQNGVHRTQLDLTRRLLVDLTQLRQEVLRVPASPSHVDEPERRDPPDPSAVCPYPGLASFQPEDAEWFCGREDVTAQLLGRVAEQLTGAGPVLVTGVSGVGKSSLVRAGLLPALARGALPSTSSAQWPWLLMTPGAKPLTELAARTAVLAGQSAMDTLRALREDPGGYGALAAQAALAAGREARLVVVVDQFEELFTLCRDPAEREAFAAALAGAAPALVVIAMRSDFFADATRLPPLLPVLSAGPFVVGPLTADELRRAVLGPAELAGLEVERGLPDLLLSDVGARDAGAIPLLAHALRSTWLRREGRRLTIEGYRATGGVRDAVAGTAERIYLSLDAEAAAQLRAGLLGLIAIADGGTVVRRRGRRDSIAPPVLDRLVAARLVTAGDDTVEISHEALLTAWPRLADWVEQDRHAIVTRQRLADAARSWAESGEDPDALYRGSRLAAAQELVAGGGAGEVERRFLAASATAAEATLATERRRGRRLRRLVVGLATALAVAVAAGGFALDQRQEARQQRDEARRRADDAISRQYAAESLSTAEGDESGAMALALDAWHTSPTPEARGALLSAQMLPFLGRLGTEPGGMRVALNGDGSRVAVGHRDGTVRLWDGTQRRMLAELTGHGEPIISVAFSPDGALLAAGASEENGVRVWDVASGQLVRTLRATGSVAWLPDGSLAAWGFNPAQARSTIAVFEPRTGTVTTEVIVGEITRDLVVTGLAVSPDGRYVAAGMGNVGEVWVWRLADRVRVSRLAVNTVEHVISVAFSRTGELAATAAPTAAADSGDVKVWRVPDGKPLHTLNRDDEGTAAALAYTPEGILYVSGGGRDVAGWDVAAEVSLRPLTGLGGTPADVAVSGNGKVVAATGLEGATILWRRATTFLPHPEALFDARFDRTGGRLATAGVDGAVRVWDMASRTVTATLPHGAEVDEVAWSADGTLATSALDGTVRLWDPGGRELRRFSVPAPRIPDALAFSPDGRLVAVAASRRPDPDFGAEQPPENDNGEVYVWDTRTGTPLGPLKLGADSAGALVFTPDGATLLAATYAEGSRLRRWRADNLTELPAAALGDEQVTDLAVSPDGRTVAVAGTGRRIRLGPVDGAGAWRELAPHPAPLRDIAFTPDGATLATVTTGDTVIRLWDVATGELTANLTGLASSLNSIDVAPDGRTLATGAAGATVGIWNLDPAAAVDRLCAALDNHPRC